MATTSSAAPPDPTAESSLRETLQQLLGSPILIFERLPSTGEATLFHVLCDDQRQFAAKQFHAPDLFWIEARALAILQDTGRVCEVVHTSFDVDEYLRAGQTAVPHFIVKPYFESLLNSGGEPVVAVERAVQLVDISKRFWKLGWRDLDGRNSNDAVLPSGRVVRFDLDAAVSIGSISAKQERLYLSGSTAAEHATILASLGKLIAEQEEVHSIASRVSRFVLRQDAATWPLLEKIVNSDGPTYLEEWISLWRNALQIDTDIGRPGFSDAEAAVLARLFFAALQGRSVSLTLNDLHSSMLAILFTVCQRVLAEPGESTPARRLESQLPTLPSLAIAPSVAPEATEAESPAPAYSVAAEVDGGAWRATRKGSDWKSQDFVACSRPGEAPLVLLADGATHSHGAVAVELVERWSATLGDRLAGCDAARVKEVLCKEIDELHSSLLKAGAARRASCETTLLLGYLCERPGLQPVLFLINFGNSGYVLTQGPAGDPTILEWGLARNPALALGYRSLNLRQPDDYLLEHPLPLGQYRLRVFSDGVFAADKFAYDMVSQRGASIGELVSEAQRWDEVHPQIGGDDWSVAGMDVEVLSAEPGGTGGEGESTTHTDPVRLERPTMELSEEGEIFWREVWAADPEARDVIRNALPSLSLHPSPIPSRVPAGPRPSHSEPIFKVLADTGSGYRLVLWLSSGKGDTRVEELGYRVRDLQPASQSQLPSASFGSAELARRFVMDGRRWRTKAVDWITLRDNGRLTQAVTVLSVFVLSVASTLLLSSRTPSLGGTAWRVVQVEGGLQIQKLPYGEPEPVMTVPVGAPPGTVPARTFRTQAEAEAYLGTVGIDGMFTDSTSAVPTGLSAEQRAIYQKLKDGGVYILDNLPSGWRINDPRLQNFVEDVATVLRSTGWKARVEVHTAIPKSDSNVDPRRLSDQRAEALRGAFDARMGEPRRVVVDGMGDSRPLRRQQESERDAATNRRLELRRFN